MWRNSIEEGYKIGDAYRSQPVDFSNYLFLRTRERLLLSNRVDAPHLVLKSGKASYFSGPTLEAALKDCEKDVNQSLGEFTRILEILNPEK